MVRFGSFRPNIENYVSPIQGKTHVPANKGFSIVNGTAAKKVIITGQKTTLHLF